MFLKLVQFSSKICIVSNKIRFKAIHHLQYRENVHTYPLHFSTLLKLAMHLLKIWPKGRPG